MPAAAVIPAPRAYIPIAVVKKLVVEFLYSVNGVGDANHSPHYSGTFYVCVASCPSLGGLFTLHR